VRPARVPGVASGQGVHEGRAVAPRVGLGLRRLVDGDGPRTAAAGEDRGRSVRSAAGIDRAADGLPVRGGGGMNRDTLTLLALTTLWTLVVAGIGAAILWQFRRRSLRVTIVVAALAPMAAALAAVFQSSRAMFISEHDSWVVLWTLAFAALLGLGMSVL